jgi:NADH:ubiquinone oxidoreductase subunit 6 (subunit J)
VAGFLARLCIIVLVLVVSRKHLFHPSVVLLIGGLFLSVLWSASPLKSLATIFQFSSYILLYLLFRYRSFHKSGLLWGIRLLVSIAIVLSAYGLYQLLYGYQDYFLHLENTPEALLPATRTIMRDWLNALSGRVFSRFALPSQFAVYLLMMFPIHGILILRERRMALKILWGLGFLLNCIMFIYTKSFGAWVTLIGLLAISAVVVLLQRRMANTDCLNYWFTCNWNQHAVCDRNTPRAASLGSPWK